MAIAMGWRKPDNVAGSSAPALMIGFFVASGGFLFGYDTGSIGGILVMDAFKQHFATDVRDDKPYITPDQLAIIVSILSAGTFVGSLLSAPAGDFWGRRLSLLGSIALFCIGVILQVCSSNIPILLLGRFWTGVGVGSVSVLVPLYQSEMAPKWIRGTMVCAYQLCITIGLLAASIVNLLTSKLEGSPSYRIPMGLQLLAGVGLSLGILMMPETPRYLVKRGLKDSAALSLSRLRRLDITHPALVEELAEIQANHEYELALGPDTYLDIFRSGNSHLGRRTLTGCVLQMLQQLSGVNFIMYYGTTFFHGANIENPFLIALIINIVNTVSTIPGLLVVETWGRRALLLVGAVGMAVCQLLIASLYAAGVGSVPGVPFNIFLVVVVGIYIFFFAASWGPVAWVVTSEIYPLKVRAKSMSVSTASNWLLNFCIAYMTPYLVESGSGYADLGAKIFFVWGAFCIISVFFVYFMVYETSKLSLEQIDEMYERVSQAWHSKGFEPSWSFQQLRDLGYSDSGFPPENELAQTNTAHTDTSVSGHSGSSSTSTNSDTDNKMLSSMGNVDLTY